MFSRGESTNNVSKSRRIIARHIVRVMRFSHRFAEPSNSLQATIRCLRINENRLDQAIYVYSDWGTAPITKTIFRAKLSIFRRLWSETRILDALNYLARVKRAAITPLSMTCIAPRIGRALDVLAGTSGESSGNMESCLWALLVLLIDGVFHVQLSISRVASALPILEEASGDSRYPFQGESYHGSSEFCQE